MNFSVSRKGSVILKGTITQQNDTILVQIKSKGGYSSYDKSSDNLFESKIKKIDHLILSEILNFVCDRIKIFTRNFDYQIKIQEKSFIVCSIKELTEKLLHCWKLREYVNVKDTLEKGVQTISSKNLIT